MIKISFAKILAECMEENSKGLSEWVLVWLANLTPRKAFSMMMMRTVVATKNNAT